MKWIIVTNIYDNNKTPLEGSIVLKVSDDNFHAAVIMTKKILARTKFSQSLDCSNEDFIWNLDSLVTNQFEKEGIKYMRFDSIPFKTKEEMDRDLDEYWVFYDELDLFGEQ